MSNNGRQSGFRYLIGGLLILGCLLPFCLDERTSSLMRTTLGLALAAAAVAVPAGMVLAWLLERTDLRGQSWLRPTFLVLLFVPLYLQTAAWDAGFGQQGWFQMGRLSEQPWLVGWRGAIWVHAAAAIPWVVVILTFSLRRLSGELIEAARLDASASTAARLITLPQLLPSIVVASIWVFVTVASEITASDVFQVRTFAEELYIGYAQAAPESDQFVGIRTTIWSGLAVVGLIVLAALVAVAWCWPRTENASFCPPSRLPLGSWRWPATLAAWLFVALLVVVPLGSLFLKLGIVVTEVGGVRERSWSLAKAASLLISAPIEFGEEIGWTFLIAQAAAITTLIIGIPFAWFGCRSRWPAAVAMTVAAVCLAIPGSLLGIGLIKLLNRPEVPWLVGLYDRSILAPWLGICIRCLPWVLLILWAAFLRVSREELEMARVAGASWWQRCVKIVLPQSSMAVAAAWLVAFAIAAGDLSVSILVVPPGVTTYAIRVFGLVHYGVEDRLAALCLIGVVAFTAIGIVGRSLLFRSRHDATD